MIITEVGIVKLIEFKNRQALQRYLDNLKMRGKGFYVISDGYTSENGGRFFVKTVESDGEHKLMNGLTD